MPRQTVGPAAARRSAMAATEGGKLAEAEEEEAAEACEGSGRGTQTPGGVPAKTKTMKMQSVMSKSEPTPPAGGRMVRLESTRPRKKEQTAKTASKNLAAAPDVAMAMVSKLWKMRP